MTADGQEWELKELIGKIANLELPVIDIKELCQPSPSLEIEEFLGILQNPDQYFIIDVRSEAEYAESHIPGAVNLALFNNKQRHNIGLLFKQKSQKLAEQVGAYYAYRKQANYVDEIKSEAKGKKILVHCWRGGNRSKSVTALLCKQGLDATRLNGGIKAFRRTVHHYLYEYKLDLIALSGQTGTGKSAILEEMQKNGDTPVLHLEEAARHASSVFGPIRFGGAPIEKQQQFETRLFMQLLPWLDKGDLPTFFSEKESPKIGRLTLPPAVQKALNEEKHIHLDCPLELRVNRLYEEYIESSSNELRQNLRERISYLKRLLSTKQLEEYLHLFDTENWDVLLERILVEYYDKVYKTTDTPPILKINNISIAQTILNINKNININKKDKK